MTGLDRKQIDFLENEFGISEEQVKNIKSIDEWAEIQEKCFLFSFEECTLDDNNDIIGNTEKGYIALSIADTDYKEDEE